MEEFGFANGPAAVDMPSIQWFPGHMAKTRRLMADSLRLVDILVELADARIPVSSRNPEIGRLAGQKPRVLLLNKCDAADDAMRAPACPRSRPTAAAGADWGRFCRLCARRSRRSLPNAPPRAWPDSRCV